LQAKGHPGRKKRPVPAINSRCNASVNIGQLFVSYQLICIPSNKPTPSSRKKRQKTDPIRIKVGINLDKIVAKRPIYLKILKTTLKSGMENNPG
jgi:hypothetical protein